MSNTRKPRKSTTTEPVGGLPDPSTLPRVPAPDTLRFDDMWLIKAATGIDVLDPPTRGAAIAACLWFVGRTMEPALTWEQARQYRLEDVELGAEDLDEGLPRDPETGEVEDEAAVDPTRGSETPSSA